MIVDQASWRWIFALNVPLVLATLALVLAAVPASPRTTGRRVDFLGAALCAAGLAGIVFALVEQPHYGWSSPVILLPLFAGLVAFAAFLGYERRVAEPMLELTLFSRRNFAVGNAETFAMYAGLAILFFFLTIFLQQVAGYSALESGLTIVPVTLVMFALSKRFGALADRFGPRLFMGAGPLIASVGILLLLRTGLETDYITDLLPALLVFSLGLSLTVAPLVATVLADADESDAGIASAINNAIARVAGLVGVSVVGVVVSSALVGDTFAANDESVNGVSPGCRHLRNSRCRRRCARRNRHRQSTARRRSEQVSGRPARRSAAASGRVDIASIGDDCATHSTGGVMDDPQIHGTIEALVAEEHELWQRESAGAASDADLERLRELRVSLDQCWDLLRQRRALREAGLDPDTAAARDASVVESYEQ